VQRTRAPRRLMTSCMTHLDRDDDDPKSLITPSHTYTRRRGVFSRLVSRRRGVFSRRVHTTGIISRSLLVPCLLKLVAFDCQRVYSKQIK
jgi:hypothetical protein